MEKYTLNQINNIPSDEVGNIDIDRSTVGLENVDNVSLSDILNTANSYSDSLVLGLVEDRGGYDASSNLFPTLNGSGVAGAILKGDQYEIDIAGVLGGISVDMGDLIRALVNSPGQTNTNWHISSYNTQQATISNRGTAQIVTQAIIEDEATIDDAKIVTAKKFYLGWTKIKTLVQTFTAKITFTIAPRFSSGTANTVPYLDVNKDIISSSITPTELSYLTGITSSIQAQIDTKESTITGSGSVTDFWSGIKTFRDLATDVRATVLTGFNSSITWARISITTTIQNALSLLQQQSNYLQSTRVISGTGIVINGGDDTKFDIQVIGEIVDPNTFISTTINVNLTAQTVTFLGTQTESFVTINNLGVVIQSLTPPDPTTYDSIIGTWVLVHSNLINLNVINFLPMYADGLSVQLHQLLEFDGFRKKFNSNLVSVGTTGTRLSHTGGLVIKNGGGGNSKRPIFTLTGATDATFRMRNQTDVEGSNTQTFDVTNIDIAGVTTTLAGGKFGAAKVWKYPSSIIRIQRGQHQYDNIDKAIAGTSTDIYIDSPNGLRNGIAIGWIIFKKSTTWSGGTVGTDYLFMDIQNNQSVGTFIPTLQTVYSASNINTVLIKSLSDFPTPSGGNITLVANTAYQINGAVNIGTNTLTFNTSNLIYGVDKSSDQLIYTGTSGMLINANKDCSIAFLTLAAITTGGSVYNFTGSTNKVEFRDIIYGSCKSLGTINGVDILISSKTLVINCSAGITIQGTCNFVNIADGLWEGNISTITCISIPSGIFKQLKISRNEFDIATTQTGISIGTPTVTNAVLSDCDFIGVGTYLNGLSQITPNWQLRSNRGTGIVNNSPHDNVQLSNSVNSNSVANTTTETLFTGTNIQLSVAANTLRVGSRIKATAWLIQSAVLTPTLTIKSKGGSAGTTTFSATAARTVTASTNTGTYINFEITIRSVGVSGTCNSHIATLFQEGAFADGSIIPSNGTKTIDTTAINIFGLSVQWGTASSNNTITLEDINWSIFY
jgi:hypothetical protein